MSIGFKKKIRNGGIFLPTRVFGTKLLRALFCGPISTRSILGAKGNKSGWRKIHNFVRMHPHSEPIILREGKHTLGDLDALRKMQPIWKEVDVYEKQLKELFEITHPSLVGTEKYEQECAAFVTQLREREKMGLTGNWIYFPWSGLLLHTVSEQEYFLLRTNRNRDLITEEEQARLSELCVGIVGLSVGSNVASALAYGGIANTMKLAEFDALETTNLNRIRARIDHIGSAKIDIVAQQIYEIDPYARLHCYARGIDADVLSDFVTQEPKPRIIFEIIDSFEMKIHLRTLAREHGIPVIMVTNLGDRVLLDVERYYIPPAT